MALKRENWNKNRRWVARDSKGRFVSWTKEKISKARAEEIFNSNKTFKKTKTGKRIKREESKLSNFKEITEVSQSSINNRDERRIERQPKAPIVQYVVQGFYKGSLISARSQKIGSKLTKDKRKAKDRAWTSFLERIAQVSGFDYDADEGLKEIDNVSNIKEGWVYYRGIKT